MSSIAMMALVLAGLLMWAIIVFFMAGRGTPPPNDVSPLPLGRKLLRVMAFVILALILIPLLEAMTSPQAQDMRCPIYEQAAFYSVPELLALQEVLRCPICRTGAEPVTVCHCRSNIRRIVQPAC